MWQQWRFSISDSFVYSNEFLVAKSLNLSPSSTRQASSISIQHLFSDNLLRCEIPTSTQIRHPSTATVPNDFGVFLTNPKTMRLNNSIGEAPQIAESLAPISSFAPLINDQGLKCHGFFHNAVLVAASTLFLMYLGYGVMRNLRRLVNGRSWVMISYYALLWAAGLLNFAWCALQMWQCSPGKEVSWNQLSLFTTSAMLCLEISLLAFLLQEDYASGLESLIHIFMISGIVVVVDALFKALCVFVFKVPLFMNIEDSNHKGKWILLAIHELVLASVYGYIAFVHFSKWREKLPPRPAFYHYIMAMFGVNAAQLFACVLALFGASFGVWLFGAAVVVYHSLYLPLLYTTFLADFFQEEEFLLDNAYYAEMRDAGFFDADWD